MRPLMTLARKGSKALSLTLVGKSRKQRRALKRTFCFHRVNNSGPHLCYHWEGSGLNLTGSLMSSRMVELRSLLTTLEMCPSMACTLC